MLFPVISTTPGLLLLKLIPLTDGFYFQVSMLRVAILMYFCVEKKTWYVGPHRKLSLSYS